MEDIELSAPTRAHLGVALCMSPPPDHDAWRDVALPSNVHRSAQGDGDLGQRMARVVRHFTRGGTGVLLMGAGDVGYVLSAMAGKSPPYGA